MKPFNIELAKQGKSVCTRDGREVKIICFDVKYPGYPIAALIIDKNKEILCSYAKNGRWLSEENDSDRDLFMVDCEFRPYKNILEIINATKKHGNFINGLCCQHVDVITSIFCNYVIVNNKNYSYEQLFNDFMWADDGSVCGIEND